MKNFALAAVAAAVTIAMPVAAQAATLYTNAADFANATVTTTDTFDSATYRNSIVTAPGFTVAGTSGFSSARSPKAVWGVPEARAVVFTFDSAITAFGFDLFDLGDVGRTTLTASYGNTAVTLFGDFVGTSGNQAFAGFTSATPFTKVTINNTESGDVVYFDNIRFGAAVPEPATWAMMLVGFAMVGAAVRRRRGTIAVA